MAFQQKIKLYLIRKLARFVINSVIRTCKVKITGHEYIKRLRENKIPIIYVIWHRHIFFAIYKFKNAGVRPLISLSQDGEIVYQISLEFGFNPVRGSSSKGGARAFLKLLNSIKKDNSEILITADGPKGPLKQIKDGTITLAHKTGSAIVPTCWYSSRAKVLKKTWDKFIIPCPFSELTFVFGKPLIIPEETDNNEFLIIKNNLKERMDSLEEYVENIYKKNRIQSTF